MFLTIIVPMVVYERAIAPALCWESMLYSAQSCRETCCALVKVDLLFIMHSITLHTKQISRHLCTEPFLQEV